MSAYQPPIADLAFALEHVVDYPSIARLPGFEHAELPTAVELLEQCGEFAAGVLAPLNQSGDRQGSRLEADGTVTTPEGFKAAYARYVEAGWGSVPLPEEYGGGGFPHTIGIAMQELMTGANMAFSLCPLLTQGAIEALLHYGSAELKDIFLARMVSGEWAATMNLTEPQAGSDVGALTTRAVPRADGSYGITGQKIFITYGDHDLSEQIVHLVLARTQGAPAGTRGISCFLVPKQLVHDDGSLGGRNKVTTVSLEHKMGIHASPTCVLSYEDATGYLIGEENLGMRIMFIMMNSARLAVGVQGVALAERAYQQSLGYARQRQQGQATPGVGSGSPIINFPDVRRMLLTQRASISGLRYLMLFTAGQVDRSKNGPDPAARARAVEFAGLLTPICKAFGTDLGNELTSLALQIHGGMGYIEDTGVAQHVRDVRIAAIYEGTNGIQAADLVGRKLPVRGGVAVREFLASMRAIDGELADAGEDFDGIRIQLATQLDALAEATTWMLDTAAGDSAAALSGSSPYLRMWGLCTSAWLLARGALAAAKAGDADRAHTQWVLANFYAGQILPQCASLLPAATAGSADLFALTDRQLSSGGLSSNGK